MAPENFSEEEILAAARSLLDETQESPTEDTDSFRSFLDSLNKKHVDQPVRQKTLVDEFDTPVTEEEVRAAISDIENQQGWFPDRFNTPLDPDEDFTTPEPGLRPEAPIQETPLGVTPKSPVPGEVVPDVPATPPKKAISFEDDEPVRDEDSFIESVLDFITQQEVQTPEQLAEGEERNLRTDLQQSLDAFEQFMPGAELRGTSLEAFSGRRALTAQERAFAGPFSALASAVKRFVPSDDKEKQEAALQRLNNMRDRVIENEEQLQALPESVASKNLIEKSILKGEVSPQEFLTGIVSLSAQNTFNMLPSQAGSVGGAVLGTAIAPGVGTILGAGVGAVAGYKVEYGASFLDHLRKRGVDLTSEASLDRALRDSELMEEAAAYATTRAAVITGIDVATSVLFAGIAPWAKAFGIPKRLGIELGEFLLEVGSEGVGEAGAIGAGEIALGKTLKEALGAVIENKGEIKAESLGALGPGAAGKTAGINAAVREVRDADKIRNLYSTGQYTSEQLAAQFKVKENLVKKIIKNVTINPEATVEAADVLIEDVVEVPATPEEETPTTNLEQDRTAQEVSDDLPQELVEDARQTRTAEEYEELKSQARRKIQEQSKVSPEEPVAVPVIEEEGEEVTPVTDEEIDQIIEAVTEEVTPETSDQALNLQKQKESRQQLEQVPEKREVKELTNEEVFERQNKIFPLTVEKGEAGRLAQEIAEAVQVIEKREEQTFQVKEQSDAAVRQLTEGRNSNDIEAILNAANAFGASKAAIGALTRVSLEVNSREVDQIKAAPAEAEVSTEPVTLPDEVVDAYTKLSGYRNTIPSDETKRTPTQKGQVTRRRNALVQAIQNAGLDENQTIQQLESDQVEVTRESEVPQPTIETVAVPAPIEEVVAAQQERFPLRIDRDTSNSLADQIIKLNDEVEDSVQDRATRIDETVAAVSELVTTNELTVNDLRLLSESLTNQNATETTVAAVNRVAELLNDQEISTLRQELGTIEQAEVAPPAPEVITTPESQPPLSAKLGLRGQPLLDVTPYKLVANTITDRLAAIRSIINEAGFKSNKFRKIYTPLTTEQRQEVEREAGEETTSVRDAVRAVTSERRNLEIPVYDKSNRLGTITIEFSPDLTGVRALIATTGDPDYTANLADREVVVFEEPVAAPPRNPGAIVQGDISVVELIGDPNTLIERVEQAKESKSVSVITGNQNTLVTESRARVLENIIRGEFPVAEEPGPQYGYREDTTEEEVEASIDALQDVETMASTPEGSPKNFRYDVDFDNSEVTWLGRLIGRVLSVKGTASIIGRKVVGPEDAAPLIQIYRDKRFETFRAFFIKDGHVVGEQAISARMAGVVPVFDTRLIENIIRVRYDHIQDKDLRTKLGIRDYLKGLIKRYEADGVIFAHNHPSGNIETSESDRSNSAFFASLLGDQYLGELIIDTGVASVIEIKDGIVKRRTIEIKDLDALRRGGVTIDPKTGEFTDELADPLLPNPLMGVDIAAERTEKSVILDYGTLSGVMKETTQALEEGDAVVVVGLGNLAYVSALAAIPKSLLSKPINKVREFFQWFAATTGTTNIILGNIPPNEARKLIPLVEQGIVFDFIDQHRRSGQVNMGARVPDRVPLGPTEVRMSDSASLYITAKWEDSEGRARHTEPDVTLEQLETNNNYNSEVSETTQRRNTDRTYLRYAENIDQGQRVLDYGGGLGFGTLALRELGHNVTLFEPFSNPDKRAVAPDFSDPSGAEIKGQYDVIISNAVLNTVPQDIRTQIIQRMGELLTLGGTIFVNARSWKGDVQNAARNGTELGNRQVITSRGTYQKGFTFEELATEISDVLGNNFEVFSSDIGNVGLTVTKIKDDTSRSLALQSNETLGMENEAIPPIDRAAVEYMVYHIERGIRNVEDMINLVTEEFGEAAAAKVPEWFARGLAKINDRGIPVQVLAATGDTEISDGVKAGALPKRTHPRNVDKSLQRLDQIKENHRKEDGTLDVLDSEERWNTFMISVRGDKAIPVVPYKAVEYANNPKAIKETLGRVSKNQKETARKGLSETRKVRTTYKNGEVAPETTMTYLLWGVLSSRLSPYDQESVFIGAILDKGQYFIDKAVSGEFNLEEYLQWSQNALTNITGNQGTSNLNLFGRNTLVKMTTPIEAENEYQGRRPIDVLHELLVSDMTGPEIRREFFRIVDNPGINTKVLSFILLATGRDDVLVIDRAQVSHLWEVNNRQSQFMTRNAYDGYRIPSGEQSLDALPDEIAEGVAEGTTNNSGMSAFLSGAQGLAIYEALEESLGSKIGMSLGQFHWETWSLMTGQESEATTIQSINRAALGEENAFEGVSVRQGKYDSYDYDTTYAILNGERVFTVKDSLGNERVMTPDQYNSYISGLRRMGELKSYILRQTPEGVEVLSQKEAAQLEDAGQGTDLIFADDTTGFNETQGTVPRIFPSNFLVTRELQENGETTNRKSKPWRLDDRVSQRALDSYVQGFGRPITETESATLSGATDESRPNTRVRVLTREARDSSASRLTVSAERGRVQPFGNPELWRLLFNIGYYNAQENPNFQEWVETMDREIGDIVDRPVLSKLWLDITIAKRKIAETEATFDEEVEESIDRNVDPEQPEGTEERGFSERFRGKEEAGRIRDDIDEDIQKVFGRSLFKPITNQATIDKVMSIVEERGIESAIAELQSKSSSFQLFEKVALGEIIILKLNREVRQLKETGGDKATREKKLIRTVDVAEIVSALGTEAGRALQAFTIWARLSPEGLVLKFKSMKNKAALERQKRNERTDNRIRDAVHVANGQAANEAVDNKTEDIDKAIKKAAKNVASGNVDWGTLAPVDPVIDGIVDKAINESDKVTDKTDKKKKQKDVIEKEAKRVSEETGEDLGKIIEKAAKRLAKKIQPTAKTKARDVVDFYVHTLFQVAKERGTNVPVEGAPTPETPIEQLGKIVRAFSELKPVWDEAQQLVVEKFEDNPMALQALQGFLNRSVKPQIGGVSLGVINKAIRQGMRDIPQKLREIAESHWTDVSKVGQSLSEKIIDEAGIPESEAQLLSEIIQNEFEKIVDARRLKILENRVGNLPDRTKIPISKTKTSSFYDELFRLANLGAVTPEHYSDILQEFYGIGEVTTEQIEGLRQLSDKAQQAPEGDLQALMSMEIAAFMAREMGIPWTEFLQAYWYANVLSGLGTHGMNFGGSGFQLLFRSMAQLLTKAGQKHKRAYYRGLKIGAQQGLVAAKQILSGKAVVKGEGKFEFPRALQLAWMNLTDEERAKHILLSPKKLFLLGRHVGNLLGATDIFWHRTAREGMAYMLASQRVADLELGNLTPKEYIRMVDEEVNHTQEKRIAAEEQAKKEVAEVIGDKATKNDVIQRTWEILEQQRSNEDRLISNQFAARMNFTEESRGSFGWLGDHLVNAVTRFTISPEKSGQVLMKGKMLELADKLQHKLDNKESLNGFERYYAPKLNGLAGRIENFTPGGIPLLRPIVPFIPVLMNVMNAKLDYLPLVGHIRAVNQGTFFGYGADKQVWASWERSTRLAEANLAMVMFLGVTAFLFASYALADDDEEPWFDIYGAGPKDWNKKQQWMSQDKREFNFKVGGLLIPYDELGPLGLMLGMLGNHMDTGRETGDYWDVDNFANALAGMPELIINSSLLKSVGDFYEALVAPSPEGMLKDLKRTASNTATGFVPYIGMHRDISTLMQPGYRKTDDFMGQVLKGVPIVKPLVGVPLRNIFGEEVKREDWLNRVPLVRRFIGTTEASEELKFLGRHRIYVRQFERDVSIYPPSATAEEIKKINKMRLMEMYHSETLTDEQKDELVVIFGGRLKARVTEIMERGVWEGRSDEFKVSDMDRIVRQEKANAKRILIFGPNAIKERDEWRKRWDAFKREAKAKKQGLSSKLTDEEIARLLQMATR